LLRGSEGDHHAESVNVQGRRAAKQFRCEQNSSGLPASSYDALNRIVQSSFGGHGSIGYAYDAGGRMTQAVDSTTGTISRACDGLDGLTAEVTPQGSVSYCHDNAARRISMGVSGHAWVRKASAGWRAAYSELMAKYPNESPANKDVFFKASVEGGSR
jgi:YD repeat-containing protein